MFRTSDKNKSTCERCAHLPADQIRRNYYNEYQTLTAVVKRTNRCRIESSLYSFYASKKDLSSFVSGSLVCSDCYETFSRIINS